MICLRYILMQSYNEKDFKMDFGKHNRHRRHAMRGERDFFGLGDRHPGRRRQRVRRRIFDPGELQLLILSLIAEQPRHGYDLIREMNERSGGGYSSSPGVVYPALTYMEEAGWIAIEGEGGARKIYAVTESGRAHLEAHADEVAAAAARLSSLAEQIEQTDPAPVRRAMHNLKTAVFDRLSQEDVDRALILQVAELIDEAAKGIERIEA